MNCTFFGHKDVPDGLRIKLERMIFDVMQENEIEHFYVGNRGCFDDLVQNVLSKMQVDYSIIISSFDEYVAPIYREKTMFPEGLEKGLPRFAICRRNEWMIKNSDIAIVYMKYRSSNCAKWVEKANKRGLQIINLAEHI